jgi:hypothetical protein
MTTRTTPHRSAAAAAATTTMALFAAVLMMLAGVLGVLVGIVAIMRDEIYVRTPDYLYTLDVSTWGWIHLVLAVVLGAAGVGVLWGATWARVVGIVAAGINLIAHFAFLPYFPVWAILIIALYVLVIWALAGYRGDTA